MNFSSSSGLQRTFAVWVALRSSLWFVPTLVVFGSMAAGYGLVEAGARITALSQPELPSLFGFGAEGSRAMLSAIATAMITIAGVAFSITIVTLSLASSQYSPRVLRQFMRDRSNQWVLGVFVGVFAYCLTVLPRVRGGDENAFVPALAVAAAVLYALIGVGCLIFFIHHVATSIQASCIVAEIATEARSAAQRVFPEKKEADESRTWEITAAAHRWRPLHGKETGYIQLIDEGALLRLAVKHDLVLKVERPVGDFSLPQTPLLSVAGRGPTDDGRLHRQLLDAFTIRRSRTIEQDVRFGLHQIVDIALRALSPSLNDPTTAVLCIDYLTTILLELVGRQMDHPCRRQDNIVRLLGRRPDFPTMLRLAFSEIRKNAVKQQSVLERLLAGSELLAAQATDPLDRNAVAMESRAVLRLLRELALEEDTPALIQRAELLVAELS